MQQMAEQYLRSSLDLWAPSFPRRVTRHQLWATGPREAMRMLRDAEGKDGDAPYISVYSFPNGHTSNGHVPQVDTLFIDFDFEDGDYEPGSGNIEAWRRDISHLLVRVRRVARYIRDDGRTGWRASLSGHKGVHLFLDFPAIDPDEGDLPMFRSGMTRYADELVDHIADHTGLRSLDDYVDVTSSDMGRLCRMPNTLHHGASKSFGEERFCVPVTIEELAEITVDDYINYTQSQRYPPWERRYENAEVGEILTQQVRNATPHSSTSRAARNSTFESGRISEYEERANDDLTLDDVKFLTSDRPCVWRFHEREDKFRYGAQSHHMELFCIREMMEHGVPIDVMKEFFANVPEYDEGETEWRIKQMIARDYDRFNISTNLKKAPEFCGYDGCRVCQRVIRDEFSQS